MAVVAPGLSAAAAASIGAPGIGTGVMTPSGVNLTPKACQVAPGQEQDIAVADDPSPGDLVDPLFHHTNYVGAVGGWVYEGGLWRQRFRTCYGAGGRPLAFTVAELLSRFYCYGRAKLQFGEDVDDSAFLTPARGPGTVVPGESVPPTNFYLDISETGGGKEQDGALYIFQAQQPRHPIELAREVAHEFSHLTLPGIRGFGPPEDWTNGYLGEVLYLTWLSEDSSESVMPRQEIGAWSGGRRDALIGAFLKLGPGPLIDVPAGHFWAFEGMLLYLRQIHGLPLLARLLNFSADQDRQTANDWQMNLGYAMSGWSRTQGSTQPVIVDGKYAAEVSIRAPVLSSASGYNTAETWVYHKVDTELQLEPGMAARSWIYLPKGRYRLNVEVDGQNWQVRGASLDPVNHYWLGTLAPGSLGCSFKATTEAWYHLQWRNVGSHPITLKKWTWTPEP